MLIRERRTVSDGPYLHSHGGDFSVGKSELIHGAPYLASPSFAEVLTGMGYAVWSIDAWGFEERGGISESELFKQFLLTGKTLWECVFMM